MIERIGLEEGNPLGLPMVPAVRAGDFVFISGQAALEDDGTVCDGGIKAQTHRTIERLIVRSGERGMYVKRCGQSNRVAR